MLVAGNDEIRFGGHCALDDAVVVRIIGNDVQPLTWRYLCTRAVDETLGILQILARPLELLP